MEYPVGGQLRSLRLRHNEERVDAAFDQMRVASGEGDFNRDSASSLSGRKLP